MLKQTQVTNKEARETMLRGVNKVGDIVRSTLGPYGKNVCIDSMITNDGVTIAQSINLSDPAENLGAILIKGAASKTNKQVGDGTTTTTILTQELSNRFSRLVDNGTSAMEVRKHAKVAVEAIRNELEKHAVKCDTVGKLTSVATISVEDAVIGKMIAETTLAVGKDGMVTVTESKTGKTYTEVFKGMKIERGWASPYMCTNKEKLEALHEGVNILVTDKNITDFNELMPILTLLQNEGIKKLVIVCDDISGSAMNDALSNRLRGAFDILAVRGPIGTQKKGGMKDIAVAVGATLFTEDLNSDLSVATLKDLGFADKVVANKNETVIINGAGTKKDVVKRVAEINTEIALSGSEYEKEKLKERAARIGSGIGVVYVGGETEAEQVYLKMKIEDAVNATRHALIGGVVAGSGYGLMRAANNLIEGVNVFREIKAACFACVEQILKNAEMTPSDMIDVLYNTKNRKAYYNIITNDYFDDPVKEGIIDPVAVVQAAITNAVSTASILITTDTLVVNEIVETE
jgi:chaperonin GroEL